MPKRRTFLTGLVGAMALGSVGRAAGHESGGSHDIHRHHHTKNAGLVGFHPLGTTGVEPELGRTEDGHWEYTGKHPLYGAVSEVWVEDDLAFVSMLSTSEPTGNRGVAIVDVSEYTRAEEREELADAEMEVLSYIGNETEAGTAADVKVSDDGQYLFYSKQAIGTLYGEPASASTDPQDAPGAEPLGIAAYDISDPENPRYIGTAQGPNAGFHNCFTHRIGGQHYVFGVQGAVPGDAGVHIYRLNENGGGLEPVNFWSGGDLSQGEYDTDAVNYYCHDFYAHDDPKTGRPLGFIAYWNNGVRVIDLSDPADIEELGFGPMERAHYAQPAPTLIDGKRVFVGSQEHGSQMNDISGEVRLFDGDNLFEDGLTECQMLDSWTLYRRVSYEGYAFSPHNADITTDGWITQSHYHAGIRFLEIQPPGEGDVATDEWHIAGKRIDRYDLDDRERIETDKSEEFTGRSPVDVYGVGGNLRHHEFTSQLSGEGLAVANLTWAPETAELDLFLERKVGEGDDASWETVAAVQSPSGFKTLEALVEPDAKYRWGIETDYGQSEYELAIDYVELGPKPDGEDADVEEEAQAYYRDHVEVPDASKTLSRPMSPNFWGARIENGVTFASGMNSGLYAIGAEPIDVGTRTPVEIDVQRTGESGGVHAAGDRVTLTYEITTDKAVHLRDRLPPGWEITGGDRATVTDVGDGTRVEFKRPVPPAHGRGRTTRTLEAVVGGEAGTQHVGPVRYSADGGETWEPVVGTVVTQLTGP